MSTVKPISNHVYEWSRRGRLFDNEPTLMTPEDYFDMLAWDETCAQLQRAEQGYSETNDRVAWETDQEAQLTYWGLPANPYM